MISAARQKLRDIAEAAKAVKRLRDTGILDLGNLGTTLQAAKNAGVYGPQASLAIQGGRKFATLPALVDERGTLTYKQVDDQSTAFARGLNSLGIDEGLGGRSPLSRPPRPHPRDGRMRQTRCPVRTDEHGVRQAAIRGRVRAGEREGGTSRQRVRRPPRRAARPPAPGAHVGGRGDRPAGRRADDRRHHRRELI